jgi:REP element-mobilizing transposase RayT
LTIPHRGRTTQSTYFVTANVLEKRSLFQVEKIARLFIEILQNYREQRKYLLHEFVVMPDHLHLILTPNGITLERAMQFVKGGFSFQLNKKLKTRERSGNLAFLTGGLETRSNISDSKITSGKIQSSAFSPQSRKNILTAQHILHFDPVSTPYLSG